MKTKQQTAQPNPDITKLQIAVSDLQKRVTALEANVLKSEPVSKTFPAKPRESWEK